MYYTSLLTSQYYHVILEICYDNVTMLLISGKKKFLDKTDISALPTHEFNINTFFNSSYKIHVLEKKSLYSRTRPLIF